MWPSLAVYVMGKDLHHTIPKFFERRMCEHSNVRSFRLLSNEFEIIYEIERLRYGDKVRVWLADQYSFGEVDFNNRPTEIRAGDYILIARPESSPDEGYTDGKIRIGKLKDFMGALTKREMWKYVPPSDEEKKRKV
jgi:hypothetical protein